MSRNDFIFLPDDNKLMRLESCDFFLSSYKREETRNESGLYQVQCCLKKILNPMLVLFYYNNTSKKILTEFFNASRDHNIKSGKKEDGYRDQELREEDLKFRLGCVNLDYESDLDTSFRNVEDGNPFKWLQIVDRFEREIREGEEREIREERKRIKYPFIVFYYQSIPQYIYEGNLTSDNLINEFNTWYTDLVENKQESRADVFDLQNGIYLAVGSDSFINNLANYYLSEDEKIDNTFNFEKGEIFRVHIYKFKENVKLVFSRDISSGSVFMDNYEIEPGEFYRDISPENIKDIYEVDFGINDDKFRTNFRKLDIVEKDKIDEEKLETYQEMFKISHPSGKDITKKKQVYLDDEFFTPAGGFQSNKNVSKNFRDLFRDFSGNKEFISDFELEDRRIEEAKKFKTTKDQYEKQEEIIKLLSLVRETLELQLEEIEKNRAIRLNDMKKYYQLISGKTGLEELPFLEKIFGITPGEEKVSPNQEEKILRKKFKKYMKGLNPDIKILLGSSKVKVNVSGESKEKKVFEIFKEELEKGSGNIFEASIIENINLGSNLNIQNLDTGDLEIRKIIFEDTDEIIEGNKQLTKDIFDKENPNNMIVFYGPST